MLVDLDEIFHDTARALGYRDVDGGFGSPCPKNCLYVDRAFANFERHAESMILQAAGVEKVPWDRTLHALLRLFVRHDLEWWLLGSTALAVRGLEVAPYDVDLVVADEAMSTVEQLLRDHVVQPVVATPDWVHNSFARAFLYSRVEWVGGVCREADMAFLSDQGPFAASHLEVLRWRGFDVRVPPLALQLETCKHRGLTERARIIAEALS